MFRNGWLAAALAMGLLLVPPAVHAARQLYAARAGDQWWEVSDDFQGPLLAERRWQWHLSGQASLHVGNGSVVLQNGPSEPAYLDALFLGHASDAAAWQSWLQPAGFSQRPYDERLAWEAQVQRDGTYYQLLEAGFGSPALRVQVTSYGIHVTYPDATGEPTGHEIVHPLGSDGASHHWLLTRDRATIGLEVDSQRIWQTPAPGPMVRLRFGDAAADDLHGGRLQLRAVRYGRRAQPN